MIDVTSTEAVNLEKAIAKQIFAEIEKQGWDEGDAKIFADNINYEVNELLEFEFDSQKNKFVRRKW